MHTMLLACPQPASLGPSVASGGFRTCIRGCARRACSQLCRCPAAASPACDWHHSARRGIFTLCYAALCSLAEPHPARKHVRPVSVVRAAVEQRKAGAQLRWPGQGGVGAHDDHRRRGQLCQLPAHAVSPGLRLRLGPARARGLHQLHASAAQHSTAQHMTPLACRVLRHMTPRACVPPPGRGQRTPREPPHAEHHLRQRAAPCCAPPGLPAEGGRAARSSRGRCRSCPSAGGTCRT